MKADDVFGKLNLKDQREILVVNPPESFEPELRRLAGVTVRRQPRTNEPVSFALLFVTRQSEVDSLARLMGSAAPGDAIVWFAYPKGSSKRYSCEFNRDTGWRALGKAGFEPVRQVAIDEDWTALRFRRAEFIATMRRSPERALSARGRAKAAARPGNRRPGR